MIPGERIVCPICQRGVRRTAKTCAVARHGHRNGGGGMSLGGGACPISGFVCIRSGVEFALRNARASLTELEAETTPRARALENARDSVASLERALERCPPKLPPHPSRV